ncbi:unnamed protein product [Brassica napus]|uniref:(rape) hypothetical protein n=1 Tax=Brassica napus TaxID=3708 RepID=A0A816U2R9_BRANA|nr:unnamed protein product [Brassica napus]
MRCSNGSAQCVNRQCQCASVKRVYPMTTNTPVSCKTIFDCAASHQCPDNKGIIDELPFKTNDILEEPEKEG